MHRKSEQTHNIDIMGMPSINIMGTPGINIKVDGEA